MSKYRGLACLAIAVLLSTKGAATQANEPQGVWRTFAVMLDFGVESVDFTDDNSVLIKVEQTEATPSINEFFGFGEELDGTLAVIGSPGAMYITKANGRTHIGTFWWLLSEETPEPPPIGSVTLTGAEAELYQVSLGRAVIQGPYILPGSAVDKRLILVTARFSR